MVLNETGIHYMRNVCFFPRVQFCPGGEKVQMLSVFKIIIDE